MDFMQLIFGFGGGGGGFGPYGWLKYYMQMLRDLGYIALIVTLLAVPMAAQDFKASPEPAKAPTLTAEEYGELALALLQFQSARLTLLDHLSKNQAGSEDVSLTERMGQAFTMLQAEMAKKRGACEGGNWNFASKVWVCPDKK